MMVGKSANSPVPSPPKRDPKHRVQIFRNYLAEKLSWPPLGSLLAPPCGHKEKLSNWKQISKDNRSTFFLPFFLFFKYQVPGESSVPSMVLRSIIEHWTNSCPVLPQRVLSPAKRLTHCNRKRHWSRVENGIWRYTDMGSHHTSAIYLLYHLANSANLLSHSFLIRTTKII